MAQYGEKNKKSRKYLILNPRNSADKKRIKEFV